MTDEKLTFGIMVDRDKRHGSDTLVVRAMVRHPGEKHPSNPRNQTMGIWDAEVPQSHIGLNFNGVCLRAHAYGSSDKSDVRLIGYDQAVVGEAYFINEEQTKGLLKTLTRVNKALDRAQKASSRAGTRWTMAAATIAFAKGLAGPTWYARRTDRNAPYQFYHEVDWEFIDVAEAVYRIQSLEAEMIADAREKAQVRC